MGEKTIETIATLLESVLELHRDNIDRLRDAAEADGDLQERLRELGYLE